MQLLQNPDHTGACVLVLGMFDGVHLGHQALLSTGRKLADETGLPLCVCTFEPHPLAVLFPDRNPPRLTTPEERAERMAAFGVDILSITGFTRELAAQPPEEYVRDICRIFSPKAIVTGFNFTFGDRGRGNSETLKALETQYGYQTVTVPEVIYDGATVSSTRIRQLLKDGRLDEANILLGIPYSVSGEVVNGKHIGRTIGFPTANLSFDPQKALPAYGVYACVMEVDGERLPALVNVGKHPTLPEGSTTIEANIPGYDLQLYDKQVKLDFLSFRRPERVFPSVDALREQITRDCADVMGYLKEHM